MCIDNIKKNSVDDVPDGIHQKEINLWEEEENREF